MADFGSTFERLELKFLITEDLADQIRQAIMPYCEPDPFTPNEGPGYAILNHYLDTPSLMIQRAWHRGDADRLKLRVRRYSEDGPAFLEVKRKVVDVVEKTRAKVPGDKVAEAAAGLWVPPNASKETLRLLSRFAYFVSLYGAEPQLGVRYRREAWASLYERYARVTFDRRIEVSRVEGWGFQSTEWREVDESWLLDGLRSPTILELKCEVQVPLWMHRLMDRFGLRKSGFSKYGNGLSLFFRRSFFEDTRDLERAPYV